jgi:Zn-dependent protease with chaperone function
VISRLKLALLIVEGYVYLALIAAIFLSASGFLVWGLLARRPFVAVVAILVGVPVAMTTARALRALWLVSWDAEGIEAGPALAPRLCAAVQEIAHTVGAPRVHRILIGRSHNATALQARYGWMPWRRNTLVLGYPLLATLTTDQVRAVIAHELAHLTHAHGRFSGWVHRTRRMWIQLLDVLERHRSVPAHVYFLYRFYVPRLNRHAAAVSRQHEVIADRLAAEVAGARVAAEALLAIEIGTYVLEQGYWTRFYERVEQEADIPNPYAAMAPGIWSDVEDKPAVMNRLLAEITQASDTHPALGDRLRAIDQAPRWPNAPAASAADEFFGPQKLDVAGMLAREWMDERGPDWRRRHDEMRQRRARLAALDEVTALTADQMFEYGSLLEEDSRYDAALERYRSAHAAGHSTAGLAAGRLLLDRGDPSGIALIDAAMNANPALGEEGCEAIVDFLEDHGRQVDAHRYRMRLNREAATAKIARRERGQLSVVDRFSACADRQIDRAALARIVQAEPAVTRAYLVTKELHHSNGTQTVLAVFSKNGDVAGLTDRLHREAVPDGVVVVVLGRHNEQIESVLREVPGSLIFRTLTQATQLLSDPATQPPSQG